MQTAPLVAAGLRKREGWKYKALEDFLNRRGIKHLFEFPLSKYSFDLALPDYMVFVEFDGAYHTGKQEKIDEEKTKVAAAAGWTVHRVQTESSVVLPPSYLRVVLKALEADSSCRDS